MEVINNFLEKSFSFSKHKIQYKNLPPHFYGILIFFGIAFIACYKLKNKFSIFPNLKASLLLRITNLWKTNVKYNNGSCICNPPKLNQYRLLDIDLLMNVSEWGKIISQPSINIDQNVESAIKNQNYNQAFITIVKYYFDIFEVNLTALRLGISDQPIIFLTRYSQLTRVCLGRSENITDVAITQIALRCPDLTSVELIECPKITDKGINSISVHCLKLTHVNFSGLNITDRPIISLASSHYVKDMNSEQLTNVKLRCMRITDRAIRCVVASSPNLTHMVLACPKITDNLIIYLAQNCKKLTSLELSSHQITDRAIRAVANNCSKLTYIGLGCPKVSKTSVQIFAKECPNLKCVSLNREKFYM